MLGCEVPVFGTNILELPRRRIDDLDVAGEVPISVDFAKLAEGLVCNVCDIELMVACEGPSC